MPINLLFVFLYGYHVCVRIFLIGSKLWPLFSRNFSPRRMTQHKAVSTSNDNHDLKCLEQLPKIAVEKTSNVIRFYSTVRQDNLDLNHAWQILTHCITKSVHRGRFLNQLLTTSCAGYLLLAVMCEFVLVLIIINSAFLKKLRVLNFSHRSSEGSSLKEFFPRSFFQSNCL